MRALERWARQLLLLRLLTMRIPRRSRALKHIKQGVDDTITYAEEYERLARLAHTNKVNMMDLCVDFMGGLSKSLSTVARRVNLSVKPLGLEAKASWRNNTLIKLGDTWTDFISAICKIEANIRDECNVRNHMPYGAANSSIQLAELLV